MSYDRRWAREAREWLDGSEANLTPAQVERYTPVLAQALQDTAEQFITDELPRLVSERIAAAKDAHEQRQIDAARGK